MPYFIIDVDFEVYCDTCGQTLCLHTRVDNDKKRVYVEACPRCMKDKDLQIGELQDIINQLTSNS